MKKTRIAYAPPRAEVVEMKVEQGYATSLGGFNVNGDWMNESGDEW